MWMGSRCAIEPGEHPENILVSIRDWHWMQYSHELETK